MDDYGEKISFAVSGVLQIVRQAVTTMVDVKADHHSLILTEPNDDQRARQESIPLVQRGLAVIKKRIVCFGLVPHLKRAEELHCQGLQVAG